MFWQSRSVYGVGAPVVCLEIFISHGKDERSQKHVPSISPNSLGLSKAGQMRRRNRKPDTLVYPTVRMKDP
jgi:hypothetical protein